MESARGDSLASLPQPERWRAIPVVGPNWLLINPPIELVVLPDVQDARLRDRDSIPPLLLRQGNEAVLDEGLDDLVRHHVVRTNLPLHLLLREARAHVSQQGVQLRLEVGLVEIDVELRHQAVQDEAAVDHVVLVRPGGHSVRAAMRGTLLNGLAENPREPSSPGAPAPSI